MHLALTAFIALLAAILVLTFWYPGVYARLSGGLELLILVVAVDLICGPLITLIVFNPAKPKVELWRDLSLVAVLQLVALGYGMHSVWVAKPLFLVLELDRFKVVAAPQVDAAALDKLTPDLRPAWSALGPKLVGIRQPLNAQERNNVTLEAIEGGRDYAERPEFYVPYEGDNALASLKRAKPLPVFLEKQPSQRSEAANLALKKGTDINQWFYLPVVARQDWIAVLNKQGQIQGFLKGDGF